jgi:hypothetical protein
LAEEIVEASVALAVAASVVEAPAEVGKRLSLFDS